MADVQKYCSCKEEENVTVKLQWKQAKIIQLKYRLSGISIFTVWNRTECKTHTKSRKASFAWFLDTFLYQFKFSIILPQQIMLPQFSQFSQRSKCYSTILCKLANRITNLLLLTSYISKNQLVFGSSYKMALCYSDMTIQPRQA